MLCNYQNTSDYASPGFAEAWLGEAGLRYMERRTDWHFLPFCHFGDFGDFLAIFLAHFDPWTICETPYSNIFYWSSSLGGDRSGHS